MRTPAIKAYSKTELRMLVNNPELDLNDGKQVAQARKMREQDFNRKAQKIITEKCAHLITLHDYKKLKVVPPKIVEEIFRVML